MSNELKEALQNAIKKNDQSANELVCKEINEKTIERLNYNTPNSDPSSGKFKYMVI